MAQFKILPNTYILSPLTCFSKKRLFEEICSVAAAVTLLPRSELLRAINQREAMGATICAKGIGMPHAVIPGLEQSLAILTVSQAEVPYNAVESDYAGVDMALAFFLSPSESYEQCEQMLRLTSKELSDNEMANSFRRVWQDKNKLMMLLLKLDNILYRQIRQSTPDKAAAPSSTNPIMQFINDAINGSKE